LEKVDFALEDPLIERVFISIVVRWSEEPATRRAGFEVVVFQNPPFASASINLPAPILFSELFLPHACPTSGR
jgi:hypothetical protein